MKILISHNLLDDDVAPVRVVRSFGLELERLGNEVRFHRSSGDPVPGSHGGGGNAVAGARPGRLDRLKNRAWFAKALARNVPMYRRDVRAIRAFGPDVVLARHDAYCASMALASGRCGAPLVVYADVPVAYETRQYHSKSRWHPPGLVEAVDRFALARARAITSTSRPGADEIARYNPGVPIEVISNGVHPEQFPEVSHSERLARRSALGVERPLVLGFQGTFRAFHGIDRLSDLMTATARRGDVHWLIVGDGPELRALRGAVRDVPATFLGMQPHSRMSELLSMVDVAVAPHQFVEGVFYLAPLKILEYAAAGCAVVAGAQGDIPLLLDRGRVGVLLDEPDSPAWVKAIEQLLDDPARRIALGRAARDFVLTNYSWENVARQYERVLEWAAFGPRDGRVPQKFPGSMGPFRPSPRAATADEPAAI